MSKCGLCELYKATIDDLLATIDDLLAKKKTRDEHNLALQAELTAAQAHIQRILVHHGKTENQARGNKNGTLEEQVEYWRTRYFAASKLADGWEETVEDLLKK